MSQGRSITAEKYHEPLKTALSKVPNSQKLTGVIPKNIIEIYETCHGKLNENKKKEMQAADHCDKTTSGNSVGKGRCRICERGDFLLIRVSNNGDYRIRVHPELYSSGAVPKIVEPSVVPQTTEISDSEREYEEGKRQLRHHRKRERNLKLVEVKKSKFQAEHGRLFCEVCSFDFAKFYGSVGEGYAECHHTTPLGRTEGVRMSRIEDLVVVCANCHRMLHRPPFYPVDKLRAEVDLRRTK